MISRSRRTDPAAARPAALHASGLLDGSVVATLDRFARLTSRVLGAPIALVSLIGADGRLLVGRAGADDAWSAAGETPFSHSFCRHVVESGEPLIVDDAHAHPLFGTARAARELGVAAYAGVPLVSAEGHALGSLCAIDVRPRAWTHGEVDVLRELAASAAAELRLRTQAESLQRQAESLRAMEHRFRLLTENVREVFWISDPGDDRLVYASPAFERIWGRPVGDAATGRTAFIETVHPDDRDLALATAARLAQGEYEADYRILRPDGEVRWIRDRGFPVLDEAGELYRIAGVAEDVTERKRDEDAERLLAEAGVVLGSSLDYRETLRRVARLAVPALADHCVVDLVGADGVLERVEAASAEPTASELLQRRRVPRLDLPHPSIEVVRTGEPLVVSEVTDAWLSRYARDEEHLRLLRDAAIRSVMVVPLNARGRSLGALLFATASSGRRLGAPDLALAGEIARRAAAAIDNARLYQRAERATRAREELLAVVSHELGSPLSSVRLGIDTLLEFKAPDLVSHSVRAQLETVRGSVEQMGRLVGDLVDITHIEAGHLAVRRQPVEVDALVNEAFAMLQPLAESRSLGLEQRVERGLPAVFADRRRILQVLSNLVGIGVGSTPARGRIVLAAATAEEGVRFEVRGGGTMLPSARDPHPVGRFWRSDEADEQGVQLGLAIARGIVETHGGRIWLEEGGARSGAVICFTLPAAPDGATAEAAAMEGHEPDAVAVVPPALPQQSPAADAHSGGGVGHHHDDAARRSEQFIRQLTGPERHGAVGITELSAVLRDRILSALHLGDLQVGDRLPSIRLAARALGAAHHAVARAYEALAAEGVVVKRERSGIFVAAQSRLGAELRGETARWVSEMLVGAWMHQIRLARLPELILRYTSATPLSCICIESTEDHRTALAAELEQQFGLRTSAMGAEALARLVASRAPGEAWAKLAESDLLVTTNLHAPAVRSVAVLLNKPLVVMGVHPDTIGAIHRRLADVGELTVVCVDPAFGERVRGSTLEAQRHRVQVILADDSTAVAALDRARPVLLTRAARMRLPDDDFRLIVPVSPSFAPQSVRDLVRIIIRLNVEPAHGRAHTPSS